MIAQQKIHSGSFLDHNDNSITVSFYKRIDLNADPTSFYVDYSVSSYLLVVWSREGEAYVKAYPYWLASCTEIWVGDLPGTNYHKHYYIITTEINSGSTIRESFIKVGIQGVSWAEIEVPIRQGAYEDPIIDLNADPVSFDVDYTLSAYLLIVWSTQGDAYVKSSPDWVSYSQVWVEDIPGTNYHKYYYSIGVHQNNGAARDGVIKVGIQNMQGAELAVPIHQGSIN